MLLGVSAYAETEIGMTRLEEGDEFIGVTEAVGSRLENGFPFGGISAQGHDVPEARGVNLIGEGMELSATVTDAGEMRHHGETEFVLEQGRYLGGAIASGAAGPVGDRNEIPGNRL